MASKKYSNSYDSIPEILIYERISQLFENNTKPEFKNDHSYYMGEE